MAQFPWISTHRLRLATMLPMRRRETPMGKTRYTKEQLEEARRLLGIETAGQLDEALYNIREFFSILQEWDEEDRALQADQAGEKDDGQ